MATGDTSDIVGRLKSGLPARWFGDGSTIRDAILSGWATAHSFLYSLYLYAKLQTRILTATDGWLDMIAADFFGASLLRMANQTDASFRAAIIANLFREKGTRNAVVLVLQALTGRSPVVTEPLRPADTGAYGSMLVPFQAFVTAYRPATSGVPYAPGYGNAPWGYGTAGEYASLSMVQGAVQDADIAAAVEAVRPAGTTIWMRVSS